MGSAWTCARCNHVVPDGRARCMYCGTPKDAPSAATPVAVPVRPGGARSADASEASTFLARNRTAIDVVLLVLAAPIAILAISTSFAVQLAARLLRRR